MSVSSLDIIALKLKFDQIILKSHSIGSNLFMMRLGLQAGDMMFYFNSDCIIKPNSSTTTYSHDRLSSTISSSTDSINQSDFDEESINSSILTLSTSSSVISYPSWTSSMDTFIFHASEDSSASSFNSFLNLQEVEGLFPYLFF